MTASSAAPRNQSQIRISMEPLPCIDRLEDALAVVYLGKSKHVSGLELRLPRDLRGIHQIQRFLGSDWASVDVIRSMKRRTKDS